MEGVVKLLRYDCVESPFTLQVMTAFDLMTIERLLMKPVTPEDEGMTPEPLSRMQGVGQQDTLTKGEGHLDDDEDDEIDPPKVEMPKQSNRLLDLGRMLDIKK
jgi:hypothetical protein